MDEDSPSEEDYLPEGDDAFIAWGENFLAVARANASALGLTDADLDSLARGLGEFRAACEADAAAQNTLREAEAAVQNAARAVLENLPPSTIRQ